MLLKGARGCKVPVGLEQRDTLMCSGRLEESLEREVGSRQGFRIDLSVMWRID